MSDHLTPGDLAGFLDQDLAEAELARVREHLDACDECRGELVELGRLLETAPSLEQDSGAPMPAPTAPPAPLHDPHRHADAGLPAGPAASGARRRGRPLPWGAAGVLAAAAVAVLVFVRPDGQPAGSAPEGQQRVGEQGVAELQVHGPRDGSRVARNELRFAWAPHGSASYRINVTREDGSLLWSSVVEDSVAAPPSSVPLPAGEALYWYVDALTGGTGARTRVHTVTVLP